MPELLCWLISAAALAGVVVVAFLLSGATLVWSLLGLLASVSIFMLIPWSNHKSRTKWRDRTLQLWQQRDETPLVDLGQASGWCRVGGRVEVLTPASEQARDVAAHCDRRWGKSRVKRNHLYEQSAYHMAKLTEERSCGRFVIRDGTNVVVVDPWEENFELADANETDTLSAGAAVLREGEYVEVLGVARSLGPADEGAIDLLPEEYRSSSSVRFFDDRDAATVLYLGLDTQPAPA